MSPYLVSNSSLKNVGITMLVIHLMTAWCAYHLPESNGRDLGHTSLEDEKESTRESEHGSEMTFRYDSENETRPASSRGIV